MIARVVSVEGERAAGPSPVAWRAAGHDHRCVCVGVGGRSLCHKEILGGGGRIPARSSAPRTNPTRPLSMERPEGA